MFLSVEFPAFPLVPVLRLDFRSWKAAPTGISLHNENCRFETHGTGLQKIPVNGKFETASKPFKTKGPGSLFEIWPLGP